MRLETLLLRRPGADERRLHFHERLTVVAGLDADWRRYLIEELLGTLAGAATDAGELGYVDRTGRRTLVRRDGTAAPVASHPDGSAALHPAVVLAADIHELFRLTYVAATDLGVRRIRAGAEPVELREARAALAALTDELQAAVVARDTVTALANEIGELDRRIDDVELGRDRRRYARLCQRLEQARAELAAVLAPAAQREQDETLAGAAVHLTPLIEQWTAAEARVEEARVRFGDRARLDAETLAGALGMPELAPADLDELAATLDRAQTERDTLATQLAGLLAAHLPDPSHPDVVRLASHDQETVWRTAQWALTSGQRVEQESIALGGLRPAGVDVPVVEELDQAHGAVEHARKELEERRFGALAAGGAVAAAVAAIPVAPLVAPFALAGAASAAYWAVISPKRDLARAEGWEEDALTRAGVPTYLAFHLRRQHALADPHARGPLEEAAEEHRRAMAAWRALAGDLAPSRAVDLEDEVRHYAGQLERLEGTSTALQALRQQLRNQAEPAVEHARSALLRACAPWGIEESTLAADLVRQLAGVAAVARLQQALESAEAEASPLRTALEARLPRIPADASLAERGATFRAAADAAGQRVHLRALGRSAEEIRGEIAQLEDAVRSSYRPEYGTISLPGDAEEPDPAELERRRDATEAALAMARRLVPDVALLADRRSALERRVESVVRLVGEGRPVPVTADQVEAYLRDRLLPAGAVGPHGERVPLLLDDVLGGVRADHKWELLDVVLRMSASGQLVYLTDDDDVRQWARLRHRAGTLMLAEPAGAPAPSLV